MILDKEITVIDNFIDKEYQRKNQTNFNRKQTFSCMKMKSLILIGILSLMLQMLLQVQTDNKKDVHYLIVYYGIDWDEDEFDPLNSLFVPMLSEVCKKTNIDNFKNSTRTFFLAISIKFKR